MHLIVAVAAEEAGRIAVADCQVPQDHQGNQAVDQNPEAVAGDIEETLGIEVLAGLKAFDPTAHQDLAARSYWEGTAVAAVVAGGRRVSTPQDGEEVRLLRPEDTRHSWEEIRPEEESFPD
jgi:hypothetical protein